MFDNKNIITPAAMLVLAFVAVALLESATPLHFGIVGTAAVVAAIILIGVVCAAAIYGLWIWLGGGR